MTCTFSYTASATNYQFPLWDMPAGNHGSCIKRYSSLVLVVLTTTSMIPCRRVCWRDWGIQKQIQFYNVFSHNVQLSRTRLATTSKWKSHYFQMSRTRLTKVWFLTRAVAVNCNCNFLPFFFKVVEFAEYGNLVESFAYHSVERLCEFTIQVATALEYLESMKVIHQSVKTFNCLVTADFKVSSPGELSG